MAMMAGQHDESGQRLPDGAQTRIAMQVGAAMSQAEHELQRESYGVELARRVAMASRAAYLTLIDAGNPDSSGMDLRVGVQLLQDAEAFERGRLMNTPREEWHR